MRPESGRRSLEHLPRDLAPRVPGAVARRHGDFALAGDAVQEALIAAAEQWSAQGVPDDRRGRLHRVALRRMTDRLRSELARRRCEDAVAAEVWAEWAFVPPVDVDGVAETDEDPKRCLTRPRPKPAHTTDRSIHVDSLSGASRTR